MKFINILKTIMKERNLSQQGLASILHVNQTTISQWLLGNKKTNYENILAIYEKFGVRPNELFGIEDYIN